MKKKLVGFILLIVTVCCAVFSLSACGVNSGNVAGLEMDKKYIYYDSVNEDKNEYESYYIFYANGTGKRRCFKIVTSSVDDYTINFKYTFVDKDKSAVVCFYDSVDYGDKHNTSYKPSSDWSVLLTVSKNVLCSAGIYGYSFYINENYLKTIPNFNT